jgi:hypothetical protein
MPQDAIFKPMGALALLTFLVLTLIPFRRFRAGFAGRIVPDDFKFGESGNVPGDVSIPTRAYMNLLEMPVLFYVICLMLFVAARVDQTFLYLAVGVCGAAAGAHADPDHLQQRHAPPHSIHLEQFRGHRDVGIVLLDALSLTL